MKAVASVVLEPQDIQQALQDHIAKVLNVTAEIAVSPDQATGQYAISVVSAEFNRTPNVGAKSGAVAGKKRGRRTKAEIEAAKANGETEATEATAQTPAADTGLIDTLYANEPTGDEAVAQINAEMAAEQAVAEVTAEPVAEPVAVTEFQ